MPFFRNEDDLRIFFEDINPSFQNTTVFLHGWGSTSSFFQEQVALFTKLGFRILLFDAEGHGKSEKIAPTGRMDYYLTKYRARIMRDINKLLSIRRIGEYGIVGHSLVGGGIAQLLAIENPRKVKYLVLLNTGKIIIDNPISNIFWNLLPKFVRMDYAPIFEEEDALVEILNRTIPYIRLAIIEEIRRTNAKQDIPSERDLFNVISTEVTNMINESLNPSQIKCPVLVIGCELDNFAPIQMSRELWREISQTNPNSEYHEISMAGHFGPSQRSKEINEIIAQFLDKFDFLENNKS
ncbi:MAG: alpha/beta fold hydrolase [Promethearchaeota archaeon]